MKRLALSALITTAMTGAALAHGGHVATSGGHDHWLAVGAAAMAIVIFAGGVVAGRFLARKRG